jgi:3-hydroxybutyryl-CoA dehydrogenase
MNEDTPIEIHAVGVVGAGVMGIGVAQILAESGLQTVVVDVGQEILERARGRLREARRLQALFPRDAHAPAPPSLRDTLARIEFTTDVTRLAAVDVVIENATEKWEVKEPLYRRLDQVCRPECVFAANTSAIPITRLASVTRRPRQVIGMHFMNPAPLKSTVEVIRGDDTSDRTLEVARALLQRLGRECVVVKDSPGFVSNRVLMLTLNEAIFLVHEQVASAEQIDHIFVSCFGHKMGPLATADLIGLDTVLYSLEVLRSSFDDDKFRPCPLLREMVDAGLHGRKSGQGFYAYS